jgi:hypothetical protein
MRLAIIDDTNRVFVVTREIETLDFLSNRDDSARVLGALDQTVGTCTDMEPDGMYVAVRADTRTDREKLHGMRKLGVRWPKGHALPEYPARMSEDAKREADILYDSMSEAFIDGHGTK